MSSVQAMIIAVAKGKKAKEWVMQEQKKLTRMNMAILRKYAELSGVFLGPDNGIRVATTLKMSQQEKEQWEVHEKKVREEKEQEVLEQEDENDSQGESKE